MNTILKKIILKEVKKGNQPKTKLNEGKEDKLVKQIMKQIDVLSGDLYELSRIHHLDKEIESLQKNIQKIGIQFEDWDKKTNNSF